jgi:hypothetical protein
VAKSVATFRGFPVCGFGATLTSDSAELCAEVGDGMKG